MIPRSVPVTGESAPGRCRQMGWRPGIEVTGAVQEQLRLIHARREPPPFKRPPVILIAIGLLIPLAITLWKWLAR